MTFTGSDFDNNGSSAMGGLGSGDYERHYKKKTTTAECTTVDVYEIARLGEEFTSPLPVNLQVCFMVYKSASAIAFLPLVFTSQPNGDTATLDRAFRDLAARNQIDFDRFHSTIRKTAFGYTHPLQQFPIDVVNTSAGATSLWFRCGNLVDGEPCDRRCRRLYLRGSQFACRNCHNLCYHSQSLGTADRLFARAEKIRVRMLNRHIPCVPSEYGCDETNIFPNRPKRVHYSTWLREYEKWGRLRYEAAQVSLTPLKNDVARLERDAAGKRS